MNVECAEILFWQINNPENENGPTFQEVVVQQWLLLTLPTQLTSKKWRYKAAMCAVVRFLGQLVCDHHSLIKLGNCVFFIAQKMILTLSISLL